MGRMAANKGNGKCISTSDPLTCTPMPIDIVLLPTGTVETVNVAELGECIKTVDSVNINGKPAVVLKSEIPKSSGAPPNAIKGVSSPPPANNKCDFVSASATVFANSSPVVRHRDVTKQNAGNCDGAVKIKEAFSLSGTGIAIDPNLSPADRERIVEALEDLAETPLGYELLQDMQNSTIMQGHTTTITITTRGDKIIYYGGGAGRFSNIPAGGGSPVPGAGSSSTIWFNPSETIWYNPSEIAGTPAEGPTFLGLGHELIHAYHGARGTIPQGNRPPGGTPNAELQAIGLEEYADDRYTEEYADDRYTENAFREELNLDNRTNHDCVNNYNYKPNPANIPPKGYRTGAGGEKFVYAGG